MSKVLVEVNLRFPGSLKFHILIILTQIPFKFYQEVWVINGYFSQRERTEKLPVNQYLQLLN